MDLYEVLKAGRAGLAGSFFETLFARRQFTPSDPTQYALINENGDYLIDELDEILTARE